METSEREQLVVRLRAAFVARAMRIHVARLAEYAHERRLGRPPKPDSWTDEFVERWAGILQQPPFETAFEVRERSLGCACRPGAPGYVSFCCEDRYLLRCSECRSEWLVILPPPSDAQRARWFGR